VWLGAAGLAVVLAGWFLTGWSSVRFEARTVAAQPALEALQREMALTKDLLGRLESLRARESERPYYHFQNLFHDPRGASWGNVSVAPSPLVEGPGDPMIATHFQIDSGGVLTIPSINEELPELSNADNLADNRAMLASLRAAQRQLEAPELVASLVSPEPPRPEPPQREKSVKKRVEPQQKVVLSSDAFAQNAMPNMVFENIRRNPNPRPVQAQQARPAPQPSSDPVITVTISSYNWDDATIAGRPHLVGRRVVATPSGSLVQGFVLDPGAVDAWVRERDPGARLVLGDGEVEVEVDASSEISAAKERAASIERRFFVKFAGVGGGALALVAMLVFVVFRSERLARQRSQFAAAAAHELRTPLAGLQLYGDMLADGLGDPDKASDYAQRIAEEAGRLGRVVTNVLGFSRLERGALSTSPQPGDVALAIRRAVDRQRSSLESAGVEVAVDLPETLTARFDDDALAQILGNLLDNAEKYTREAEDRRVSVSACRTRDEIAIEIADSGAGIGAVQQKSLFLPFERLGGDDAPAGLGLGLALSRELARSMGGDLRYTGKPDTGGAKFVLLLPR
jgi:signal transduction histidine kinase